METMLDTPAQRAAALKYADTHLRVEGHRCDPSSDPIFAAWVRGDLTKGQVLQELDAKFEREQRERRARQSMPASGE